MAKNKYTLKAAPQSQGKVVFNTPIDFQEQEQNFEPELNPDFIVENIKPDIPAPTEEEIQQSIPIAPMAQEKNYLSRGDTGYAVQQLQQKLIKAGYSVGIDGADGDFGGNTLDAVIKFQKENRLTVDGLVGEKTLAKLDEVVSKKSIQIYRIRKNWYEPKTQIGAYNDLDKAIEAYNKLPDGYYVYNNSGKIVYPEGILQEKKSSEFKPIVRPARSYNDVALGMAAKDENCGYRNGLAGDQSGSEVYILNTWYDQSWTNVLRPVDNQLAEKIAQAMEAACENNYIGYDQNQRNTLYTEAKKVGMDLSKITTPCECDCSSLVSICCICAGLPENIFFAGGNMRTTFNMEEACLKTGKFINYVDAKYTRQKDYLKRGDILNNRNQHVVVVLGNGRYAEQTADVSAMNYKVKVLPILLNVRNAPNGNAPVVGRLRQNDTYTIVEVQDGWGKLKSGAGWINLEFVEKI